MKEFWKSKITGTIITLQPSDPDKWDKYIDEQSHNSVLKIIKDLEWDNKKLKDKVKDLEWKIEKASRLGFNFDGVGGPK